MSTPYKETNPILEYAFALLVVIWDVEHRECTKNVYLFLTESFLVKIFWSDFAKDISILCLYLNYFTRFVISTKLKTMISGCGEHDICYFVSNRWTPTCFYNFQAMAPNQKFNI